MAGMLGVIQSINVDAEGKPVPKDQRILRIDPTSGVQSVVASGDELAAPYGIAFDAEGQLIVSDLGRRAILKIDPATGAQSVLSSTSALLTQPFESTTRSSCTSICSNFLATISTSFLTLLYSGPRLKYISYLPGSSGQRMRPCTE